MAGKVAVEVAMVRGAMLNLGYYDRTNYKESPLPIGKSPLYDHFLETRFYCKREIAQLEKKLGKA